MTTHGKAILTRRLSDGSRLTVLESGGWWFWAAIAADGGSARYSREFASRAEAHRAAVLYANEVELAKVAGR